MGLLDIVKTTSSPVKIIPVGPGAHYYTGGSSTSPTPAPAPAAGGFPWTLVLLGVGTVGLIFLWRRRAKTS